MGGLSQTCVTGTPPMPEIVADMPESLLLFVIGLKEFQSLGPNLSFPSRSVAPLEFSPRALDHSR
jgi:hypothetical protein